MRNRKMWQPSPSMVVAVLALSIAFVGSAVAAKKGVFKVRSKNIVNGQVKTPDLANNSVKSVKIGNGQVKAPDIGGGAVGASALAPGAVGASALAPDSVGGQNIQNDSLTGDDINESSLQGVDAQTLGGASGCQKSLRIAVNNSSNLDASPTLCTIGPFTFSARCEAQNGGDSVTSALLVSTSENDAFYSTNGLNVGPDEPNESDADWDSNERKAIVWHNEFTEGDGPSLSPIVVFNAFTPSGQAVSGQASVRGNSLNGGARQCDLVLSVIG